MCLYSLPLLRDSQSVSKPLFTTCGNERGGGLARESDGWVTEKKP